MRLVESEVEMEGEEAMADEFTPTSIYISPLAFLRTMCAIAWSAFRHPLTTTVIDLSTGKVISPEEDGRAA